MELHVWDKPSVVLRALMEARHLMANHDTDLKDAMDALVRSASEYIDKQEVDANPFTQAARQKEEDEVRKSAVDAARMVAKILLSRGGDAAREALGVPPPNPLEQQRMRATLLLEPEKAASQLNSVVIEIDDDADHGEAGRHYRVAANLYLPVHLELDERPVSTTKVLGTG
jgi:hypothetical protein